MPHFPGGGIRAELAEGYVMYTAGLRGRRRVDTHFGGVISVCCDCYSAPVIKFLTKLVIIRTVS